MRHAGWRNELTIHRAPLRLMTTIQTSTSERRPPTMTVDLWPAFTTFASDDVVVAAVSLTRLVEWCGTPCVHTADAALPGTHGLPSPTEMASIVIARVVAVQWRSDLRMHVTIDADLDGCRPILSEARVIGRQATVHRSTATLEAPGAEDFAFAAQLPSDVVLGDLIAVPCLGATLLHDVKVGPQRSSSGWTSVDQ
jgi:hypothetical protein